MDSEPWFLFNGSLQVQGFHNSRFWSSSLSTALWDFGKRHWLTKSKSYLKIAMTIKLRETNFYANSKEIIPLQGFVFSRMPTLFR